MGTSQKGWFLAHLLAAVHRLFDCGQVAQLLWASVKRPPPQGAEFGVQ